MFLFVVSRFRYSSWFPAPDLKLSLPDRFNPLPHDSQSWESLLGSPVAGTRRGPSPQMYNMPVVQQKGDW
ncbi:TPA: hypothetical protein ACGOTL_000042 [Streptococcus suis]